MTLILEIPGDCWQPSAFHIILQINYHVSCMKVKKKRFIRGLCSVQCIHLTFHDYKIVAWSMAILIGVWCHRNIIMPCHHCNIVVQLAEISCFFSRGVNNKLIYQTINH